MNSQEWGGGWRQKGQGWTKFEKCHIGESNIGGLHRKEGQEPSANYAIIAFKKLQYINKIKFKKMRTKLESFLCLDRKVL